MALAENIHLGQMVTLIDSSGAILTTMLTEDEAKQTEIDAGLAHGLLDRAKKELQANHSTDEPENSFAQDEEPLETTFTWSHHMIVLLLEEYKKKLDKFRNSSQKKSKTWDEVAKAMRERNKEVYFTGEVCDRKFRNMIVTYRKIKKKCEMTKKTSKRWRYLEMFDDMFEEYPGGLPVVRHLRMPMGVKPKQHLKNTDADADSESAHSTLSTIASDEDDGNGIRMLYGRYRKHWKRKRSDDGESSWSEAIARLQTDLLLRLEEMHSENVNLMKENNALLNMLCEKLSN